MLFKKEMISFRHSFRKTPNPKSLRFFTVLVMELRIFATSSTVFKVSEKLLLFSGDCFLILHIIRTICFEHQQEAQ